VGTVVGILAGAVQGYLGGKTDLFMQRFIEIWSAMPELYLLIIFSSMFKPSALLLLVLLSLFGDQLGAMMHKSPVARGSFIKQFHGFLFVIR